MTTVELEALRQSNSMFKLIIPEHYDPVDFYKARVPWFKEKNFIAVNKGTEVLLGKRKQRFIFKLRQDFFEKTPNKIFFNYGSNCSQLAKAFYAKEGWYCGHNWHQRLTTNSKLIK